MGMPGVGKGTQAALLRDALDVPHVSTGDILREAVRASSPLGRRVKSFLESGDLVPDEVMGELIAERLQREDTRRGFILDGFPRTIEQVATLDAVHARLGLELTGLILLTAPETEIVRRLSGRRICPECGAVYHLQSQPSASPGLCDACGSALIQRTDDSEAVIRERLQVYSQQTQPVAQRYRQRGLLHEVDGTGEPQEVFDRLKAALGLPR